MRHGSRFLLLILAVLLALGDLGIWIYFYTHPPAPQGLGIVLGLAAALAVLLAILGGLPDLLTLPPQDDPWEDDD